MKTFQSTKQLLSRGIGLHKLLSIASQGRCGCFNTINSEECEFKSRGQNWTCKLNQYVGYHCKDTSLTLAYKESAKNIIREML